MYPLRVFLTTLIVIASLLLTACPSKTIAQAKAESGKLATYANQGVDITRTLYEGHIFSSDPAKNLATKDKIADGFIILGKSGMAFDTAVSKLEAQSTNPSQSQIDDLFALFDSTVVSQFLDVLKSMKLVTNTTQYANLITTLTDAVLVIAKAFGKKSQVQSRLATA